MWQEDKAKVRNVKIIPNEECVPEHQLLVIDMRFNTIERWRKKFEPRVHIWNSIRKDVKSTKAWSKISSGSRVEVP